MKLFGITMFIVVMMMLFVVACDQQAWVAPMNATTDGVLAMGSPTPLPDQPRTPSTNGSGPKSDWRGAHAPGRPTDGSTSDPQDTDPNQRSTTSTPSTSTPTPWIGPGWR